MSSRSTRRRLLGALGGGTLLAATTAVRGDRRAPTDATTPPPGTAWTKRFGTDRHDFLYGAEGTDDGFVLAGTASWTRQSGGDAWLLKVTRDGTVEWERTIEAAAGVRSVVAASDGGYVFAGRKDVDDGDTVDAWLLKVTRDGATEWEHTVGGDDDDRGRDVVETSDGGYALAGGTTSASDGSEDALLVKVSPDGERQWQRTYGGSGHDWANSVVEVGDGGFVLAGDARSSDHVHGVGWLARVAADGTPQWERTYGGKGADEVARTSDGGYVFGGETNAGTDGLQGWLVKVSGDGTEQWKRNYGGGGVDYGTAVLEPSDGGAIFVGARGERSGDALVVKTAADGTERWTRTPGGASDETASAIVETNDGFLLAGYTDAGGGWDGWLVKLSQEFTPPASPTPTPTSDRSATPTSERSDTSRSTGEAGPTESAGTPGRTTGASTNEPTATTATTPGFGLLASLAGVVGWGYLRLRRRGD